MVKFIFFEVGVIIIFIMALFDYPNYPPTGLSGGMI